MKPSARLVVSILFVLTQELSDDITIVSKPVIVLVMYTRLKGLHAEILFLNSKIIFNQSYGVMLIVTG